MTLSKNAGDEEMMDGMSGALPDDVEGEEDGEPKTLADLIFAKINAAESGGGVVEGLRRRREEEAGELAILVQQRVMRYANARGWIQMDHRTRELD